MDVVTRMANKGTFCGRHVSVRMLAGHVADPEVLA